MGGGSEVWLGADVVVLVAVAKAPFVTVLDDKVVLDV